MEITITGQEFHPRLHFSNVSRGLSLPYAIPTELVTEFVWLLCWVSAHHTRYQLAGADTSVEGTVPD